MFDVSSNKDVENFVNKYLTTNQSILQKTICGTQLHEHKQTCKEKMPINLRVSIFQTKNEMLKNIISF
jgi:hypothetical protein